MASACVCVGTLTAFPGSPVAGIVAVVLIPFVASYLVTRDSVNALTLVWVNELFFGVSGNWAGLGMLSGRALLLSALLALYFIKHFAIGRTRYPSPLRPHVVFFYGIVMPAYFVVYSVLLGNASPGGAISDVLRLATLLIYFPLRRLVAERFALFRGWLDGASCILALLYALMALGPVGIRNTLIINWMSGGNHLGQYMFIFGDTTRAATTPMILCSMGIFSGMVCLIGGCSLKRGVWASLLVVTCTAPYIVNYLRGALLSALLTCILLLLLNLREMKPVVLGTVLAVFFAIVAGGGMFSIYVLPESLSKWELLKSERLMDILSRERVEQTGKMLADWKLSPVFGRGVGAPVRDYSRTDDPEGLAFEVQYPMILYRVGVVGFVVLMGPFVWMGAHTLRKWRGQAGRKRDPGNAFLLSVGCVIFFILCASWFNPYLASAMTPFFVALYLATDDFEARGARQAP